MREAIQHALRAVEAEHSVRVLFACESGSRAWGFASPDSDWDVRFVHVHDLDWYLRIFPGDETITRMLPGDLDLSGWELRKALGLFAKSNVAFLEHLGSDIHYVDEIGLSVRLRALIPQFFDPLATGHHYLMLAKRIHHEHLTGETVSIKKLFYVLRPLAALRWIQQRGTMPPTLFRAVLEGIELPQTQREWIAALEEQKARTREKEAVPVDPAILRWLAGWLEQGHAIAKSLPSHKGSTEPLDELLVEILTDPPQRA